MSLEIFISEAARVHAPCANTIYRARRGRRICCHASGRESRLVRRSFWQRARRIPDVHSARAAAVPRWPDRRVPRAPCSSRVMSRSSKLDHPPNSCPMVRGTASCRWVRIFTMLSIPWPWPRWLRGRFDCGDQRVLYALGCGDVPRRGNVSFDDCDMLTSSLG